MLNIIKNKIVYGSDDFEDTIKSFEPYVDEDMVIFSIYQGSLTLGHRISKQYDIPHSILKYQRLDGNDSNVTLLHDALGDRKGYQNKSIWILDDIFDTGETMEKCTEFIQHNFFFESINKFTIFSNSKEKGLHYQHLNKERLWVQFTPWEGNE
jgi:hypoxanthine phosphoribosyltransferase